MRALRLQATTGGATRFVLALTACLIAIALTAIFAVRHLVIDAPARAVVETAREVSGIFREAFQVEPRIVVRGRTISEQQAGTLKLTTLEHSIVERYQLTHSWLGSTKTYEIEGDFVVGIGFNLEKAFVIVINPNTGELRTTLPDPEILSVDLVNLRVLTDADGLWNKLTPADQEQATAGLRARVTRKAAAAGLTRRVRADAEQRLRSLLATDGRAISFEPAPPP